MKRNRTSRKFNRIKKNNLKKPDWLEMLRQIRAAKVRNDAAKLINDLDSRGGINE